MNEDVLDRNNEMDSMPLISIIIVNWNGREFLRDCFRAIADQTYRDFEVVFVDNASSDGSVPLANELSSDLGLPVKVVELPTNTGFTGGNIEGLKHCLGKYIALLNNDTVASKNWLESLVKAMDNHPEVGICASKLIVAGTDMVDSAGDILTTSLRAWKRGEGHPSAWYEKQEYIFAACAGAALYRGEMIEEIGFLDEDFFATFEDVDFSFRAQLAGWKCLFVPEAVVEHKVSASLRKLKANVTTLNVRNERILLAKDLPLRLVLTHVPVYIFEELAGSLQYHVRQRTARAYLKGLYEFFKEFPRTIKKRREIMRKRKVSSDYIASILTKVMPTYRRKLFVRLKRILSLRA